MSGTAPPFKFDEIGYWSEVKLEIVEKYGAAYTNAFRSTPNLKKYYVDAFSGAGVHVSKRTGQPIEGSPARALKVVPPFHRFYFIDMDADKIAHLQRLCAGRTDVHIHTGDANRYLTKELLPTIQFRNFNRALCLLDPYGLHLDWEVLAQAGQSQAVDMFLNFPVMDMNRNATRISCLSKAAQRAIGSTARRSSPRGTVTPFIPLPLLSFCRLTCARENAPMVTNTSRRLSALAIRFGLVHRHGQSIGPLFDLGVLGKMRPR
jgi:hypothetical protein